VAAAQDVDVKVVDGLAAVGAGVDDHAIAVDEPFRTSNFSGSGKQVAEERSVTGIAVGERGDVFSGNDEEMSGRLRIDVEEGDAAVVLVNELGGDGSGDDLAEEALHGGTSVQEHGC